MKSLPRDHACASARECGRVHVRGSDRDRSHGGGGFEDRESEKQKEEDQFYRFERRKDGKLTSI